MTRFRLPAQILLLLIVFLSIITFAFDLLEFYSSIEIQTWNYMHEALSLFNVFLYFFYLRSKPFFREKNVTKNLKSFLFLLAILYVVVIIARYVFPPVFSQSTFPQSPETLSALIYANIASLVAVFLMVPMLISIKNLITYKHKPRTNLYSIIALAALGVCIILTVAFETPLNLDFEGTAAFSNSAFLLSLLFLFILATRNSWITYLSRNEKLYYFILSVIVAWLVIYVFDFGFKEAVPSHSLALAVYSNVTWLFLVFYSLLASFNLLLHLPTARVFDRKMKEVSSLHDLSRAISVEFDFKKLTRMITDMSSEVIESSATWLELEENDSSDLRVVSSKNLDPGELAALNNRINQASSDLIVSTKRTLVVNDLQKNKDYRYILDWKPNIGSFTGVPLIGANGQVFGILYATKSSAFGFDPDDVNMLEAYANQASIAIENAELLKKSFERERMEKELQIAREVQLRLLPQQTPKLKNLEIETLTITAYEVGGDYYDFYSQSDSELGLIIGDVSGKGTSAAFYMAEAKGIIQSLTRSFQSPRQILSNTNKILYDSLEKKSFISLLAARIDPGKRQICFARAGHCPVIHYSATEKKVTVHQPGGMAVGLDRGELFDKMLEESTLSAGRDDILVFYTDGLSEARNRHNVEFGEERLCRTIRQNAHSNVAEIREAIINDILQFLDGQNLHDDLTLILIKFN